MRVRITFLRQAALLVLTAGLITIPAPASGTSARTDNAATGVAARAAITYRQIRNRLSGKCLQPWGNGGNGMVVTQRTCDPNNTWQRWFVVTETTGVIRNQGSGKCLDEWDANPSNGQLVLTWDCYGGARGQQWRPVHKDTQYWELRVYHTDKCLDLAADNRSDGAVIQQWGCNWGYNANQQWWIG